MGDKVEECYFDILFCFCFFIFGAAAEATVEGSTFDAAKLTVDEHCYECKVRFRDPKPKDLMMFLHAWRYKVPPADRRRPSTDAATSRSAADALPVFLALFAQGPGWEYETQLPSWAQADWHDDEY